MLKMNNYKLPVIKPTDDKVEISSKEYEELFIITDYYTSQGHYNIERIILSVTRNGDY